ncbi:IS110 family transposase [Gemmobacter sp.]|uniref:IS110 family transposase n=1 Tax=Gemmobacter sp. TaxID=1898957 RepID=UPI002AFF4753|nr:transposase [Gemmobacter sp.]
MIPAAAVIGMDVSRDWLDGFCASGARRLCLPNTVAGHAQLLVQLRTLPQPVRIGFEAKGGQEWMLWATLVAAGVEAVQLSPAQIKAFALSGGTRAKTDRIDAELIAGFMLFRSEAGRRLPEGNLRVLATLTTRRGSVAQIG